MNFSNLDPRYTNLRRIGRGGFGDVYRAHDGKLHRDVAIKFLKPELASDPTWRRRFRQEATAAGQLNHINITIIFELNDDEHEPYIVMEFVDGKPLSTIIDERTTLTDPERLQLLEQLCAGLQYAHQRQIVHRDIKPVNLMVHEEHDGTQVVRTLKILDFGIAKMVNTTHTMTAGPFAFTPNYVSPEQILGFDADLRSDIFAVGAVAYELIVLRKAFEIKAKNQFQILEEVKRKIVDEPHTPMTAVRPDVDPELVAIVDRALAKDPAARYGDLGEMRRRVRAVRERLEQALEASGAEPTVVVDPRPHQAMRRARELMNDDDPQGAVAVLEEVLTLIPTPSLRLVVDELLTQARDQTRLKQAREAEAARAAVAAAIASFQQGNQAAAVHGLESFEPRALVAHDLAQLQQAAALVVNATHAVNEEPQRARQQALRALETFERPDLVANSLKNLSLAAAARDRADAEEEAAAQAAIAAARTLFNSGARADAIAALQAYADPRRVVDELNRQRRAVQQIDRASAAVKTGDRRMRAGALDELATAPERDLIEHALSELRTLDGERQAAEDHASAAATLVKSAREQFEAGDRDGALARLKGFTPVHPTVSDVLTTLTARAAELKRAEEALRAARDLIEHARVDFQEGRRNPAIAALEAHQDWPLVPEALAAMKGAASAVTDAERAMATGDAPARAAALKSLSRFKPADLVAGATRELERRAAERDEEERQIALLRTRAELEERARAIVKAARDGFATGQRDEALKRLERFPDHGLVADALGELQRLAAFIANIDERVRSGSPEERRLALAELEAATPAELLRDALVAGRALDAERTADERRKEEDARAAKAVADATAVFDEGRHDAAIAQLEGYAPSHASVTAALSALREKRARIEAERERAALVQEAEAASAHAREEFAAGDRDAAIERLSAFRDPSLIAGLRDALSTAAREIEKARASVATGPAAARRDAIGRIASLTPPEWFKASLDEFRHVDSTRSAEEVRHEAERLVSSTREQFLNGQEEAALQALERFQPVNLVEGALSELRNAHDAIARARQLVETGDDDARQHAVDSLRAFTPAALVTAWVDRLHEDHLRRRAAELRAREERELRERAEQAAAEARQAFEEGRVQESLARLEGFDPPHPVVSDLLAEFRDTLAVRDLVARANESLTDGHLSDARTAIDEARAKRPADSVVDGLYRQIRARQRDARMRAARYVAVRFLVPGVLAGAAIVGSYEYWQRSRVTQNQPPPPQPHNTTSIPVPSTVPRGPSPEEVAQEVQGLTTGGRLLEAAQRIEQVPGWDHESALRDVAKKVVTLAQEHMRAVKTQATQAGAATQSVLAQAGQFESEAAAHAEASRLVEAVNSYSKAEQLFNQAIASHGDGVAATNVIQKALAERRLSEAADLIVQDLAKPELAPLMPPFVRDVQGRAQQAATAARKQALDAAASDQQPFKDADAREKSAQRMTNPLQLAQAVKQYQEAVSLYGDAVEAKRRLAGRQEQQIKTFVTQVRDLIAADKLTEAAGLIVRTPAEIQGDDRVASLTQAVTDRARQKVTVAKKAASDANAFQQKAFTDAIGREHAASEMTRPDQLPQAVQACEQAAALFQEALREKPAEGPAVNARVDVAAEQTAINQLLGDYRKAYERLDEDAVRRIDPGFRGFSTQERTLLKSVQLSFTDLAIDVGSDGKSARLTARQNFTYEWKRSGLARNSSGTISWSLLKSGGSWRVQ
jgi:hypothetical protein